MYQQQQATSRQPMKWEQFAALWAAYFKPLTVNDGLGEWQYFISTVYSERLMREVVEELAQYRAEVLRNNPAATVHQPKLMDVKTLFFKKAKERKAAAMQSNSAVSACPVCKGSRMVQCLVSNGVDELGRDIIIVPEEYKGGYRATAVFKCPRCVPNAYADDERRELVERACIPDSESQMFLYDRLPQRGE